MYIYIHTEGENFSLKIQCNTWKEPAWNFQEFYFMVWTFFALHRKNSAEQLSSSEAIQACVGIERCRAQGCQFHMPGVDCLPRYPTVLEGKHWTCSRNCWVSHQGVNGRPSPTVTNWKLLWLMMSQAKGQGTLGRHLIYLSLWNNSKKGTLLDYMSHLRKIFIIAPAKRLMIL